MAKTTQRLSNSLLARPLLARLAVVFLLLLWAVTLGAGRAWAETSEDGTWDYEHTGFDQIMLTAYHPKDAVAELEIPSTVDGYTVTQLGNNLFRQRTELTGVQVPSTIAGMGGGAFEKCTNLVDVYLLTDDLQYISDFCFADCNSLKSITIPASVTSIEGHAFECCWSLEEVTFTEPSSLKSIGGYAFDACSSLKELTIPASVTSIEAPLTETDILTYHDPGFEKVTFLSDSLEIDDGSSRGCYYQLFNDCHNLTTIVAPDWWDKDPTAIGAPDARVITFMKEGDGTATITGLRNSTDTTFEIPGSIGEYDVHGIGAGAFANNANLQEIVYPSPCHITSIGSAAFLGDVNLQSITIPASVTTIGDSCFLNCTSLKSATFETTSIDTLLAQLFMNCSSLEAITIPEGVTDIGRSAFLNTGIKELAVPEGVTSLGESVAASCPNLQYIWLPSTLTHLGEGAFTKDPKLMIIHMPNSDQVVQVDGEYYDKNRLMGIYGTYGSWFDAHPEEGKYYRRDWMYDKVNLSEATLKVVGDPLVFNGRKQMPVVGGSRWYGNLIPTSEYPRDINLDAGDCDCVNAGTGKVIKASGNGYYFNAGTVDVSFDILPASVDGLEYDGDAPDCTWDGAAWTPAPKLKVALADTYRLKETDRTLAYADNVNAGTAKINVTGTGNMAGKKTLTFNIAKADLSKATVEAIDPQPYFGVPVEVKPKVSILARDGKTPVVVGEDQYDLDYTDNNKVGTAKVTLTAKDNANVSGSLTVEFEIVKPDIKYATIAPVDDQVYSGEGLTPKLPSVMLGSKELAEGTDYDLTKFENNVDAGTATITISGKGSISGTTTTTFTIKPRQVTLTSVSDEKPYDGKPLTANSVEVTGMGWVSGQGARYDFTGSQTKVGSSKNTFTYELRSGTKAGNYDITCVFGTLTVTASNIEVLPRDIAKASVAPIADKTYTGSPIKPALTVTYEGEALVVGTDYTVSWRNNVSVGTATAVITGKGDYEGTLEASFRIVAKGNPGRSDTTGGSTNKGSASSTKTSNSLPRTGDPTDAFGLFVLMGATLLAVGTTYRRQR